MAVTVSGEQSDGKFRIQRHCREIVAGFIVRRGKYIAAVSPHLPSYYPCRRGAMNKISTAVVFFLWLSGAVAAQESRWVTFKTSHNEWGATEHQIDRNSIRQEGAYKIFWTRVWLDRKQQAMVFNRNEALVFLSQKFAVDCAGHRFGSRFIDSNEPAQMKRKAMIETMHWEALETVPVVGRVVCAER
jgi:hypothetical protein